MRRKSSALRKAFAVTLALVADACLVHGTAPLVRAGSLLWLSVWLLAFIRCCLALTAVYFLNLGQVPPAPARFLALHSALPAALESLAAAVRLGDHPCGATSAAGVARCWMMCAGLSLAAALFWEGWFPDSSGAKKKRQKPRVLFMRVVRMYRPDLALLLGGFGFLTLAAVCEIQIRFYTGKVIDNLRDNYVPDEFLSALLLMGVFSVGSLVGTGGRGGLLMWAINSFMCRVKGKLFRAQTKQEIAFFDTTKIGELTSLLSKDIPLMAQTVCLNINVLLRTLIKTVYTLIFMLDLSWTLTCLVLMEVPVTGLIQSISDKHCQRLTQATHDSMTAANETANEILSAARTVRSFNAEKHEARRYDNKLLDTHRLKRRRDTLRVVSLLVLRLTGLAIYVLMLWYARLLIQRGHMTIGNLVSFILYQSDIGHNIRTLIYISSHMVNSVGAAGKVFEVLDRQPQIRTDGELAPDRLAGHVIFRHLKFTYPAHPDVAVLQDFSLELPVGQITALVGVSGEGKSTCASLLKRLYEPHGGQILLDDVELELYDCRYLSKKIAVVSQEPVLFSGSIRYNIAYGLADCSLDAIQKAALQANAHDFITQLKKGYDTEVGEGGSLLSKSERQRVAIARALVRQPRVLVLDEVTSSLDERSQNKVLQDLVRPSDRTVLLITHNLKNIETADQIVVIGAGSVQERGTHCQLMEKNGMYCKMRETLATAGS
ncbi:antigen peptide transporter 2-like [Syngnathus acus]|uniref:antigen peptide transporter 2-like n=1 Tax=Syngnathus acus TaxID=161584 RepID=UPI0018860884|nr:antigen peptide transporter 2-like [Syngnathus acus]XP_037128542.1 antigen peptide transporter 2-like [Syngnathus acus]